MDDLKQRVIAEFRKLSQECRASWSEFERHCELSKNGIVMRIRWSIERIEGVFVTIVRDDKEYGLPYLVEFRGGDAQGIASASSDDPKATAAVAEKYALDLLDGVALDFVDFARFVDERVSANMPPTPVIKATKFVRPEWL